jgi:hypothetical protein
VKVNFIKESSDNMPPVEIEELDDNYQSPEEHLDQLLKAHQGDAKKLLAFTFGYLNKNTSFFKDSEASKVLARLLRDVKGAPKASNPIPVAQKAPPPTAPPTPVRELQLLWYRYYMHAL